MRYLLPLLFLLAACAPTRETTGTPDPPPEDDRPQINFGWSFGMCGGECLGELIVATDGAVSLETRGWGNEVFTTVTGTAHADTLEALGAAYDALDRTALQTTYGCPDCADGGAEYARFVDSINPPESTWEYGNPPAELQAIRDVLRPLTDAVWACEDGQGFDLDECLSANGTDPEPPPPG